MHYRISITFFFFLIVNESWWHRYYFISIIVFFIIFIETLKYVDRYILISLYENLVLIKFDQNWKMKKQFRDNLYSYGKKNEADEY